MAVPKKKTTQSRKGMRRAHDKLSKTKVVENNVTGDLHRPHHVSPDGYYQGRMVTNIKVRP